MRRARPEHGAALASVGVFLARAVVFFALALALWWWARDQVVLAPAWLADRFMHAAFAPWVAGTERTGHAQALVTTLQVVAPDGRLGEAVFEVGLLKYGWGTPLLAALLLATRPRGLAWKLPLGWLALLPFQAFGVCAEWLMRITTGLEPAVALQTGFGAVSFHLIGAAYQLGFLLLPSLVPVLLWLAMDRRLVAAMVLDGSLSAYRAP